MKTNIELSSIREEDLLKLHIKDLPLSIEGSWLADCVKELYRELESKGIKFKPLCYLTDEWFVPNEEPEVGIPFFLAHPALIKLEKKMVLEAEGESKPWCMKLLRHTALIMNYVHTGRFLRKKWKRS